MFSSYKSNEIQHPTPSKAKIKVFIGPLYEVVQVTHARTFLDDISNFPDYTHPGSQYLATIVEVVTPRHLEVYCQTGIKFVKWGESFITSTKINNTAISL